MDPPRPPPISEQEATALANSIIQLSGKQPPSEMVRLIDGALARAPSHPVVLNAAGGYLHRSGDASRAKELFERAIAVDGESKVLWFNLAGVYRTLADATREYEALERALSLDPRYVLALLHKGQLLERLGKPKQAALSYDVALNAVDAGALAPAQAASMIEHARKVVHDNSLALEAFLKDELTTVRARHGDASLTRYQCCEQTVLGRRRVYASKPKQIHFPYLPAIEFFPREQFPWLQSLEAATEDIAAEAQEVLRSDWSDFRPYIDVSGSTPLDQWSAFNRSEDWSVYPLWHDGAPVDAHLARCPRTAQVLKGVPLCDIPGWAPGVFFSVLKPHVHLPAHTGSTNTRAIAHLPLIVPGGCRFRVGAELREVRKGSAWVFDDSIEHEAWNDSDAVRVILIFDVWNPLLSPPERDMVRGMTNALGRYYDMNSGYL